MAIREKKTQVQNSKEDPKKKQSRLGYVVKALGTLVNWLIVSCFMSILVSLFCLTFIWPEQGSERDRQTLIYESKFLATQLASDNYIIKTIVDTEDSWVWAVPEVTGDAVGFVASWFTTKAQAYSESVMYTMRVFMVRVLLIASSIPLIFISIFSAFLVGLVERDLRRFNLARESSTKFHLLLNNLDLPLMWMFILYLSWPMTANPAFFILPFLILLTILVFITTAQYKKYF